MREFEKILRNAAKCLVCGDTIESKHRHDWVQCSCGNVYVDGGYDYCRAGFSDQSKVQWLYESRPWSLGELNQREEELVKRLMKPNNYMAKYDKEELEDLIVFRADIYYNDLGLPEDE